MKFRVKGLWKWLKRISMFLAAVAVLSGGLLGYTLDRTERIIASVNVFIQRGDLVSAEDMLAGEENLFLVRLKDRFKRLRDGRVALARCRVSYGLGRYDTAVESCLAAAGEVRSSEEKFFAYYYIALSKFNRGDTLGVGAGAATDAIHYLKEALKVKEDGEAQALLAALLEEEAAFKEMMKGQKEKGQGEKEKSRMPSLFRDEGEGGAGAKGKGY